MARFLGKVFHSPINNSIVTILWMVSKRWYVTLCLTCLQAGMETKENLPLQQQSIYPEDILMKVLIPLCCLRVYLLLLLHHAIFSLVGHGWKRTQSNSLQMASSKLTGYQSSIAQMNFGTLISKSR